MSARFPEVPDPAARVLFSGRVPPGRLLRLDERGEWRLEVDSTAASPRGLASRPAGDAGAVPPSPDAFPRRRQVARAWGAAGLVLALLACGVAASRWRGRPHGSPGDDRFSETEVVAEPPRGETRASQAQHSMEDARLPAVAAPSATALPEIVPPPVLGRGRAGAPHAKSPPGSIKRLGHVVRRRAPGRDEGEDAAVFNEGPVPEKAASTTAIASTSTSPPPLAVAPGPPGMVRGADRLVALPDGRTALVTDPSSRLPRAVIVGSLLPSGARLLSVDPGRGVATTDRGALELK